MLLLDTHALVWTMWDVLLLGRNAKSAIENALVDSTITVSAISFWEVSMLSRRGRIKLYEDVSSWRAKVVAAGIQEIPVTGDVAIVGGQLENLHGDPGDRIIAATALINGAVLLTADRQLLSWPSPVTRLDARR